MGLDAGPSRVLHDLGEDGTGQVELPPADLSVPTITATGSFEVDGAIHIAGGNILWPPTGLRLLVRPGDLLLGRVEQRGLPESEPTPCYAGRQVEVLTLTLPPERHVQRLPAGRTIATEAFEFTSRSSSPMARPSLCGANFGLAHRPAIVLRPASRRRRAGAR